MEPCVRPGQTSHKPPPASHTIQHQHTTTTGLENLQNATDSLGKFESRDCQTQQATCLHTQHRPSTFQRTSNPSPSQVLEQLAQSLQSQSLAVKRRSEWSNYLNHNHTDEAMEVDPMAEDVMQDPFIQSQKLSALYHKARYPRDRIPREVFEAQRMAKGLDEEQPRPESSPLTLHAQQRDGMDTNGDSDESARHIPTTSPRGPNTLIVEDDPNAQLGPEILLSYRRSAHVATRNPYVVHKATRMRKRVRTSAHTRRLPHKGDKGKAVANELGSSTLPDK